MSHLRLDTRRVEAWRQVVTGHVAALMESFEDIYGYPAGDNTVVPADHDTHNAASTLTRHHPEAAPLLPLYSAIDHVSLPDMDNGHFVHSPATVIQHLTEYGRVDLADGRTGIVFASDGGGRLFSLADDGRVHRSRAASWSEDFHEVAGDVGDFLDQLRGAVEQFTYGTAPDADPSGVERGCSYAGSDSFEGPG